MEYWDERYKREGMIWGGRSSVTAKQALEIFRRHGVKSVMVPGAGYGRNARFFQAAGLNVTGLEIAGEALRLARAAGGGVTYVQGSALAMPFGDESCEAIYGFSILHLFDGGQRRIFVDECRRVLRRGAPLFLVVFAQDDPDFGRGREIEQGTYETRPGKPVHYFSEEELRETLRGFENIEIGRVEETLSHTVGEPCIHKFYWVSACKPEPAHDFDGEAYRKASRHQKEWGNRLLVEIDLPADASILDLGCGDGLLAARLASLASSGMALGIDSSPGTIAAARKPARPNPTSASNCSTSTSPRGHGEAAIRPALRGLRVALVHAVA